MHKISVGKISFLLDSINHKFFKFFKLILSDSAPSKQLYIRTIFSRLCCLNIFKCSQILHFKSFHIFTVWKFSTFARKQRNIKFFLSGCSELLIFFKSELILSDLVFIETFKYSDCVKWKFSNILINYIRLGCSKYII